MFEIQMTGILSNSDCNVSESADPFDNSFTILFSQITPVFQFGNLNYWVIGAGPECFVRFFPYLMFSLGVLGINNHTP